MFLFCNILPSLFSVFVQMYEVKLFPVGLPINFSLCIDLYLRLLRCFVTVTLLQSFLTNKFEIVDGKIQKIKPDRRSTK